MMEVVKKAKYCPNALRLGRLQLSSVQARSAARRNLWITTCIAKEDRRVMAQNLVGAHFLLSSCSLSKIVRLNLSHEMTP